MWLTLSALDAVGSLSHTGHGAVETDEILATQLFVLRIHSVVGQCAVILTFIIMYEDCRYVDAVGAGHAVLAVVARDGL